jgi:hypothetical protein
MIRDAAVARPAPGARGNATCPGRAAAATADLQARRSRASPPSSTVVVRRRIRGSSVCGSPLPARLQRVRAVSTEQPPVVSKLSLSRVVLQFKCRTRARDWNAKRRPFFFVHRERFPSAWPPSHAHVWREREREKETRPRSLALTHSLFSLSFSLSFLHNPDQLVLSLSLSPPSHRATHANNRNLTKKISIQNLNDSASQTFSPRSTSPYPYTLSTETTLLPLPPPRLARASSCWAPAGAP